MNAPETAFPPAGPPRRAAPRDWVALAVLALPCLLISMDLTVLNLALPAIARDLGPSPAEILWIVDIYGFMVAGFLIPMGALGDRIGRRRLLLCGAAAFGAASVAAAFAPTAATLILARAALGVAGATLAPSTLSLIASLFEDERERAFAISVWVTSFSVGAVIGPLAGGVALETLWWGAVFLFALPAMAALLALGPLLLPEFRDPDAGRIDAPSVALSIAGTLAAIWGVKRAAEGGFDPLAVAAVAGGLALAGAFLRRQARLADPVVDLTLFRSRTLSLALAINLVTAFCMLATFVFTAQYLQLVAGLGPMEAALWSVPSALAFVVASPFTATLAARLGPAWLLATGLSVAAAGFVGIAVAGDLVEVVAAGVALSLGFAPVASLTTALVVGAAPVEKAGVASALSETGFEFGGALGVALLGSAMTAIYGARMAGVGAPGLDGAALSSARASLAGAVEAMRALPAADAGPLLAIARGAFMDAFRASAAGAAGALVLLAGVTLALLRPGSGAVGATAQEGGRPSPGG